MLTFSSRVKTVFLAGIGFVLGLFGFSASLGLSPRDLLLRAETPSNDSAKLASSDVCVDPHEAQKEIYFLSCGGIY